MERKAPKGWHVRNWSVWGWLETVAKGIGIGAAIAGVSTVTAGSSIQASGLGYGVVGLVGLLTFVAVIQVALRIAQKELISLAFAGANLLGYVALLYLVLYAPEDRWAPMIFGGAYLVGELTKQRFLAVSGYTESGQSQEQMMTFSRVMAGLQALMVGLAFFA